MKKLTFQRAKTLQLVVENTSSDFSSEYETFHQKLNENIHIKELLRSFLGDEEEILYLLADNFESIQFSELNRDFTIVTPEFLAVFTTRRILVFKNVKNKNYYRSKNQIPGLERGFHLFDSCIMIRYNRVEHFYFEGNTLAINQCSANINEKSDRLKIEFNLYDFCYDKIAKIIGNYM